MKSRLFASLICLLFVCLSASRSTSAALYSLQPNEASSKDTIVYQFLADTPLEGSFNTILGVSNASNGHSLLSLIQFDLSSLSGAGVTAGDVTSAKLRLRSAPNSLGGGNPSASFPVTADVYATGASWVEATATWNNAPAASGGIVSSAVINSTSQLVEFDVTSLVQSWLDGSVSNFGMRLQQAAEVINGSGQRVGATFVAANGAAADRPLLEITTVPEPSSFALLGAAALGMMGLRRRFASKTPVL